MDSIPESLTSEPPPPVPRAGVVGRALDRLESLFLDHALLRLFWNNFAEVVPGRLYRAGHPTPGQLAAYARRHGVRTVISLRGVTDTASDALSRAAAERLGIDHVDAGMYSRLAPVREDALRLLNVYARMREPALLHCKSGVDRTGYAAGVFLLANGGHTRDALAQLSIRFGHFAKSGAGIMDAFFLTYAAEAEGRKPFAAWLAEDYDEAGLQSRFKADGLSSFLNDVVLARE